MVEKNIPQEEALDRLVALIKANGDWPILKINRNDHDDSACSLSGSVEYFAHLLCDDCVIDSGNILSSVRSATGRKFSLRAA